MGKILLSAVLVLLSGASSCFANNCFDLDNCILAGGNVGIGYTYRHDDFSYCLEERILTIPFITNRKFDNLSINQITGYEKFYGQNHFYFKGQADYGWIASGDTSQRLDIDDVLNFHQKGETNDKYVIDVSGGLGYIFDCGFEDFKFIPMLGYSWHHQEFQASHLEIVFDLQTGLDPKLKLRGLKEFYDTNWYGPWIGFDILFDFICGWKVFGGFEYHWVEYQGKFKRDEFTIFDVTFPDFTREDCGCGQGFVGHLGITFNLCCKWYITFMGSAQSFDVHCGRGIDSDEDIIDLKSVDWNSYQGSVALHYPF